MFQDELISDFTGPKFRQAFQLYFQELGINVRDWDGLFQEINSDGRGNRAFLRTEEDRTVGFIQFCPMVQESWFFTQKQGFIREFWIAPEYRGQGHGSRLLALAEEYFAGNGINTVILTTNTAPGFYERHGYRHDSSFQAKNHDPVYVKSGLGVKKAV